MKIEKTNYWTFFCNPKIWAVDLFLKRQPKFDTYQITDWQKDWFDIGQLGLLRVGKDTRSKKQLENRKRLVPGIYAIVEIISKPKKRGNISESFWYNPNPDRKNRLIVEIKILSNLVNEPITLDKLKNNPLVTDKYLINGFQASSFPLDYESFIEVYSKVQINYMNFNEAKIKLPEEIESLRKFGEKYKNAVPQVKKIIAKRIERGKFANQLKKQQNYECEICKAMGLNTTSFLKRNGVPYIKFIM